MGAKVALGDEVINWLLSMLYDAPGWSKIQKWICINRYHPVFEELAASESGLTTHQVLGTPSLAINREPFLRVLSVANTEQVC